MTKLDISFGEPYVVREILDEVFDLHPYDLPDVKGLHNYPDSVGYEPLVRLLEQKHGAKVIITNGAKQALGGCFYALKELNYPGFAMKSPYWLCLPSVARIHGIHSTLDYVNNPTETLKSLPYLLVAPNNPDGYCDSSENLLKLSEDYKSRSIPFIHDAAYYTHTYLPPEYNLVKLGDVQVYSISKMFGLSGLRIGYVVCHNDVFYELIKDYMNAMTTGCSMMSQVYLHDLLNRMKGYPSLVQKFEGQSHSALQESKKIIMQVDPEVLEVPSNLLETPGMFLWAKVGPKANFEKAGLKVMAGHLFGLESDYVRINLAFNQKIMTDIVTKLNEATTTT